MVNKITRYLGKRKSESENQQVQSDQECTTAKHVKDVEPSSPWSMGTLHQFFNNKREKTSIDDRINDPNKKSLVIKILEELQNLDNVKTNTNKIQAYKSAIAEIQKEYPDFNSIGRTITSQINEVLNTNTLKILNFHNQHSEAVAELSKVYGIGISLASKLYKQHNIKTIQDLRQSKYKLRLNESQLIGIRLYEDLLLKIPRKEIEIFEKLIDQSIQKIHPDMITKICGSYRRGLEQSGDIDLLVTLNHSQRGGNYSDMLRKIVSRLQKDDIISDVLSHGPKKFMGVCILPDSVSEFVPHKHRRIDIRFVTQDQFHCATLYFTGSAWFNALMRIRANQKDLHISEYAVWKGLNRDSPLRVTCEKDVFDYIGMKYFEPTERDWTRDPGRTPKNF
ncbi:DNA polymerase beta [Acrasis kona]|uniref:DNA polymerase n=1 Tax=Acrasis kona TaxID=1008807 RepID=A0AAW2ZHG3_9EUKA